MPTKNSPSPARNGATVEITRNPSPMRTANKIGSVGNRDRCSHPSGWALSDLVGTDWRFADFGFPAHWQASTLFYHHPAIFNRRQTCDNKMTSPLGAGVIAHGAIAPRART